MPEIESSSPDRSDDASQEASDAFSDASHAERDLDEPVEEPVPPPGEYTARAGSYYRNVRYAVFVAALALGAYFLYDGYVGYPQDNERYAELLAEQNRLQEAGEQAAAAKVARELDEYKHHSDTDIFWQKVLGYGLPPVGILLMARWWYKSRGQVRLDPDDTLHVPGHDPIPLASMKGVDDRVWDRKGIADVEYTAPEGEKRARLDDFVYERGPIDKIHDRLAHLVGRTE